MKINKSWYVKPKNIKERLVAGGVVVRKEDNKLFLLLIKERDFDDYGLPKGGVGDTEDVDVAAKREIKEETGIDQLELIKELGTTERLTFQKDYWSICRYFLFRTGQISGKQNLQADEDFVVEWFDINKLPNFFWPDQKQIVEENLEEIKKSI